MRPTLGLASLLLLVGCATFAPRSLPTFPRNFDIVDNAKVYRGMQPIGNEYKSLRDVLHIKTLLKLNCARKAEYDEAEMHVVCIPLSAATVGDASSCPAVQDAYHVLIDTSRQPVYVHCQAGRDRTGFVVALYRLAVQGWTMQQVESELNAHGNILYPHIRRDLRKYFDFARSGSYCDGVLARKVSAGGSAATSTARQ